MQLAALYSTSTSTDCYNLPLHDPLTILSKWLVDDSPIVRSLRHRNTKIYEQNTGGFTIKHTIQVKYEISTGSRILYLDVVNNKKKDIFISKYQRIMFIELYCRIFRYTKISRDIINIINNYFLEDEPLHYVADGPTSKTCITFNKDQKEVTYSVNEKIIKFETLYFKISKKQYVNSVSQIIMERIQKSFLLNIPSDVLLNKNHDNGILLNIDINNTNANIGSTRCAYYSFYSSLLPYLHEKRIYYSINLVKQLFIHYDRNNNHDTQSVHSHHTIKQLPPADHQKSN